MNVVIRNVTFHFFLVNIFIHCIRDSFSGFHITFIIIFPNLKACQWTTFIFYNIIYNIFNMVNFITPVLLKRFSSTISRNFPSLCFFISELTFERKACMCINWFYANSFIIVVISAYSNCNVLGLKSNFLFFTSVSPVMIKSEKSCWKLNLLISVPHFWVDSLDISLNSLCF